MVLLGRAHVLLGWSGPRLGSRAAPQGDSPRLHQLRGPGRFSTPTKGPLPLGHESRDLCNCVQRLPVGQGSKLTNPTWRGTWAVRADVSPKEEAARERKGAVRTQSTFDLVEHMTVVTKTEYSATLPHARRLARQIDNWDHGSGSVCNRSLMHDLGMR